MKNILIIIDMQNGFNRYEQTHILANKITQLTNKGLFDSIIATRFLNKEGSQYTRFLDWHRLQNKPDIDLIDGINADYIVDKNIYTCVNNNFLSLLRKLNDGKRPKYIFICGADTDCCVLKTATDLFEKNIMPIVLTNYCDSNGGPLSHEAGLRVMGRLVGRKSLVEDSINSKEDLDEIISSRTY